MQSLIADENLRISLGNNARVGVKDLDINNYVASLRYIYASVVA